MRYLGLDPGIGRTGFGLISTAPTLHIIHCGCLTTPQTDSLPARLHTLAEDLTTLIKQYRPEQAAVEDIFFGANTTTAMLTAHARGVLLATLQSHHIPSVSFTPLQIKSRLVGYGRATKEQVLYVVMQRLHLATPPRPDDAVDALAAALCLADQVGADAQARTSYTVTTTT